MARAWEYVYTEGETPGSLPGESIQFEYRPGETVNILVKSGNSYVELIGMPFTELAEMYGEMVQFMVTDRMTSGTRSPWR